VKSTIIISIILIIMGCGPINRMQKAMEPIKYDNVIVSVVADNVLFFPPMQDKEFMQILTSRLSDSTISEITRQGNLKVVKSCEPRTLKVIQEVTGVSANTVTDVSTGFFLFQLFRGSATSTKSDYIYIDTTTSVMDCESSKVLGVYPYQNYGQNPIEILRGLALYNVWYVYSHQRGN
jgi:hypothetical protein